MLNLETRQILILNILLQQKYISLEQLILSSNFSQNTILSEIHLINKIMEESEYHCQIKNHRGKGYTLDLNESNIKLFKKHCFLYLSLASHDMSLNHERILWILRYIIIKNDYLKSEELAQMTHMSLATLNKDLRVVRQILLKYNITIESTPYYGMSLKSSELSKRCCFIDYCDIYIINEKNIFPQYFMQQFQYDYHQLHKIINQVKEILIEKKVNLDVTGLKRISLYLLTLPLFMQQSSMDDYQPLSIHNPIQCLLERYYPHIEENEKTLFSLFYLSVIEIQSIDHLEDYMLCVPEAIDQYHQCLKNIQTITGFHIAENTEFIDIIKKSVYKIVLREKYQIFNFSTPYHLKQRMREEIASYSFTHYLFHALYPEDSLLTSDYLFYEVLVNIYHSVYLIKNEYYKSHALVVNGLGYMFSKVAVERLKRSLNDIEYSICYEYELDTINYTKYDFVLIYNAVEANIEKIPIPVYEDDMKNISHSSIKIWSNQVVKKRKVKVLRPYLDYPVYSTILNCSNMIDIIIDAFINKGYVLPEPRPLFKKLLQQLIYDGLYDESSKIKIMTLYTHQNMDDKYFAFSLKEPIYIENGKIVLLHFLFMDATNGPIIIKNGDSELRRYFNM